MTVPSFWKAGASAASFSGVVSGRGCSSRDSMIGAPVFLSLPTWIGAISSARRPDSMAAPARRCDRTASSSCSCAGHAAALRHLLGGDPERERAVHRLHARVDHAPPEGGVEEGLVAAREAALRLGHDPRRARHLLDAAGDDQIRLAGLHQARRVGEGLHARAAQPVDRHAGHRDRQAGEQEAHARDVAVVLAGLVGAAGDDVVDALGRDAGALEQRGDDVAEQIVGAHRARARRRGGRTACAHRRSGKRADSPLARMDARRPESSHHAKSCGGH